MIDAHATPPPDRTRRLGRSRRYTAADLPARLQCWHAPRANRWECLYVVAGVVGTEWLDAADISTARLGAGERRWIPPGSRWRISHIDDGTSFELEIHADETVAAAAPQLRRAALLDDLPVTRVADMAELKQILDGLMPGELRLLRAGFDCSGALQQAMQASSGMLSWHPLETGAGTCTALIARSSQAVGLADYLGRDHAVIEATLAGALRGNREHARWLRYALMRHLAIEEDLLFPAYLKAGGRPGWVRGLLNEHRHLRKHLPRLDDSATWRRFLLLLDGHDEKEEKIVYPDIVQRLADRAEALARMVMHYPNAAESA